MTELLIFGAGGSARETAWIAQGASGTSDAPVPVAYVVDRAFQGTLTEGGLPVLTLEQATDRFPGARFVAAVGDAALRQRFVDQAMRAGLKPAKVIGAGASIAPDVVIGEGTIIAPSAIVSVGAVVGGHVQVNFGCTVSHDVILGDFVTLSPGVHVCGWVDVRRGAFLGAGAVVINGSRERPIVIGEGTTVGAGACVVGSLPAGVTAIGVPARIATRAGAG